MGRSIKIVTLLGDEEVVVGRCHPGQARILRKAGMAEWQKDKLLRSEERHPFRRRPAPTPSQMRAVREGGEATPSSGMPW